MARLIISVDQDILRYLPRQLLRPGDALSVAGGGRPMRVLEETVEEARTFGLPVYASIGTKRLAEIRKLPVDKCLLDWEPSTWGAATWGQATNMTSLRSVIDMANLMAGPPVSFGLLISAVPLNPKKGYKWNYGALSAVYGPVIVQAQGHIHRSPVQRLIDKLRRNTPFEEACAQLREQHNGSESRLANVGFLVSLDGEAPGVSVKTAVRAVQVAESYGIDLVFVGGKDVLALRRFLLALGRKG